MYQPYSTMNRKQQREMQNAARQMEKDHAAHQANINNKKRVAFFKKVVFAVFMLIVFLGLVALGEGGLSLHQTDGTTAQTPAPVIFSNPVEKSEEGETVAPVNIETSPELIALNDEIVAAQSKINEYNNEIQNLENQINTLLTEQANAYNTAQIDNLNAQTAEIRARVELLQEDIKAAKSRLAFQEESQKNSQRRADELHAQLMESEFYWQTGKNIVLLMTMAIVAGGLIWLIFTIIGNQIRKNNIETDNEIEEMFVTVENLQARLQHELDEIQEEKQRTERNEKHKQLIEFLDLAIAAPNRTREDSQLTPAHAMPAHFRGAAWQAQKDILKKDGWAYDMSNGTGLHLTMGDLYDSLIDGTYKPRVVNSPTTGAKTSSLIPLTRTEARMNELEHRRTRAQRN